MSCKNDHVHFENRHVHFKNRHVHFENRHVYFFVLATASKCDAWMDAFLDTQSMRKTEKIGEYAKKKKALNHLNLTLFERLVSRFADRTGLEPATPCVTGMYSNQAELPIRFC